MSGVFAKWHARLLSKLLQPGAPAFSRLPGANGPVEVQALCDFSRRDRIFVGDDVRFLRGAMVYADAKGKIILHNHAVVCRYAVLQSLGGDISIGENSMIGDFCNLFGHSRLYIGRDVMVASGARIVPQRHTFESLETPIKDQPCESAGIEIGDDVWIGTNVVILDGVRIGNGSVIGAGSVVTESVPEFSVAVGIPAKVVRDRRPIELHSSFQSGQVRGLS